jgi:hypothetical protein
VASAASRCSCLWLLQPGLELVLVAGVLWELLLLLLLLLM